MSVTFDLRERLAGRAYPTTTVTFWIEEAVWFEADAVSKRLARETDPDAVKALEAELDTLEQRKREEAYTAHLRAISTRAYDELVSKALSQFPIRRGAFGRDSFEQERGRNKLIRELTLSEHLTKIVSPDGREQAIEGVEGQDVVRMIIAEAPDWSVDRIEQAIKALEHKFVADDTEARSADF